MHLNQLIPATCVILNDKINIDLFKDCREIYLDFRQSFLKHFRNIKL